MLEAGDDVVITGAHGIGKSLLALAYAYGHLEYYQGGIVFLRGDSPNLIADLASLAAMWGVPNGESARETAGRLRQALQDPSRPALLLLDNLDDLSSLTAEVRAVLPQHPCRRLATTRLRAVPGMRALQLDNLRHDDAVALLTYFRDDATQHPEAVARIVTGLERWVLGVTLVGVYLSCRPAVTWEAYADDLDRRGLLSLQDVDNRVAVDTTTATDALVRPDRYHQRVTELVGDMLGTLTTAEQRLLAYAAVLPRDLVPVSWLVALLEGDEDLELREPGPGETSVATSIVEDLLVRSLLRETDGDADADTTALRTVAVHRLMADELVTRLHAADAYIPRMQAVLSLAMSRATYLFDHAIDDQEGRRELPVLLALLEQLSDDGPFAREAGYLANETLGGLWALGDLASAHLCAERAVRLGETTLPPEDPELTIRYSNFALVLKDEGDLSGARSYLERAVAIAESALPSDDPNLAISYSNFALVLKDEGDLSGARSYLERAIAIEESMLPSDHPTLARSYSNVAVVLRAEGDLSAARRYLERANAIWESALPSDDPNLAISYSNLAMVLQDERDLSGARSYLERALAIDESALPSDHPHLAIRYSNLAVVLRAEGDLSGARRYLERAIAIEESALPSDHPTLAASYSNLATVLRAEGDLSGARSYLERAITIQESALPADHPTLAASYSNLAVVLHAEGDLSGARRYLERATTIQESARPGGTVTRVFLSYATEDQHRALQVFTWLTAAGMHPRLDRHNLGPGVNFILEMSKEAEAADLTLALGTEHYFRATFTEPEWTVALVRTLRERRPRLVVARFDDNLGLPAILQPYPWTDLRGLSEADAQARLVDAVRRAANGEEAPPLGDTGAAGTTAGGTTTPTTPIPPRAGTSPRLTPGPTPRTTPPPPTHRRVVATRGSMAASGDIVAAVLTNRGTPSGPVSVPAGEGVFADAGSAAAGGSIRNARVDNDFAPAADPVSGAVEHLDLAVVGALLADARRRDEQGEGGLAWLTDLTEERLVAVEAALAGLDTKVSDVRDMVETLWEPAASAQNRTALQRFAKSLPERAGWEVLKRTVLGVLS
jgi:tetratricopeptide (TPR) repeat protein